MLSREDLVNFDAWSAPAEAVLERLATTQDGISEDEADRRQSVFGLNELAPKKRLNLASKFLSYFFNPLIALLLIVGAVSYIMGNLISAGIIFAMVLVSVCITFYQEYTANDSADKLRKMIRNTATVIREEGQREIPLKFLVPGDIVRLSAGDMVPADCRILIAKDFFINQASLTGESLPVEKCASPCHEKACITEKTDMVFFGSSVVSGSAEVVVAKTGVETQFGELSLRLSRAAPETAFDRGIREYSMLMVKFVVVLVLLIFFINAVLRSDIVQALLFALAVAVGLTPEMLPAMVTANLSKGANSMAKRGVIVKRLPAIQNLGAMDVLCTDKTGTLTEDRIKLVRHVNAEGKEDEQVLQFAYLNSYYQTGLRNPLDVAVLVHDAVGGAAKVDEYKKVDEIPFDFARRRMSVVVCGKRGNIMLTKGAPESVLPLCTHIKIGGKAARFGKGHPERLKAIYDRLSSGGFRVLALASKSLPRENVAYGVRDEKGLTFDGFLAFLDPPKKTAKQSLFKLMKRGIEIKILSGDNELVNQKIAGDVGLNVKGTILGRDVDNASDESLQVLVEENTIFARVSPIQKERIILALQRNKHVVGFLGDGINDSLALKTSDIGISVDSAVDVAKESADIILLRKSLHVLYEGVDQGRKTFANIMKYLKMGSSSNFGNMFSVVGGSIFLPFLPMAPLQLILNNFLYDMSQLTIPADNVDQEELMKPAKWNIDSIKNFMVWIGPVSSIFDYITFGVLLFIIHAPQQVFHAGWFIESIMTQTLVIHVIRTNKIPFLESRPNKFLILSSIAIVSIALLVILTPIHTYFGFEDLPAEYFPMLAVIVVAYLCLTQLVKMQLYKRKII